jgi:hypothetical protein
MPAFVTLIGTATVVTDPGVKAKHWKESWAPFYKNESRGVDFALLKFVPHRLEIVSEKDGLVNERATWRPGDDRLPARRRPEPDAGRRSARGPDPARRDGRPRRDPRAGSSTGSPPRA